MLINHQFIMILLINKIGVVRSNGFDPYNSLHLSLSYCIPAYWVIHFMWNECLPIFFFSLQISDVLEKEESKENKLLPWLEEATKGKTLNYLK